MDNNDLASVGARPADRALVASLPEPVPVSAHAGDGPSRVVALADRDAWAFKVHATVFLPESKDTSVKLGRGDRLFVLTDKGLSEAPHSGPDDVHIAADWFGCWPVVALRVRAVHADKWRSISPDAIARMMARVRRQLARGTSAREG